MTETVATFVNAGAAVAVFLATLVLAHYTRQLAHRTAEPFVVFYLRSSGSSAQAMNQVLVNTGTGTAFDVVANMSPAPPSPTGAKNDNSHSRRITLLPPGQEIAFVGAIAKEIAETTFDIDVSWAAKPNGWRRKQLRYSVTAYDGYSAGFQEKNIHHVAVALEKLAKNPD